MNGEAASANQRLGVARNDALQGATLAFQHSRDPSPNVRATNVRASTPSTAMASDHRPLSRQRTGSDAPEVGSVKDKIGRLARPLSPPANTSLSVRGRTSAASLSSASQIAARLAASRSPGRDTSVPSTTARLGAGAARSASRVPPSPEKRQLPAPTPLRSTQGRDIPPGSHVARKWLKIRLRSAYIRALAIPTIQINSKLSGWSRTEPPSLL
ncbi:hypothetical protein N7516_006829 [Penicillium verrucosum]|uniref:uncharacterized protein n=1 Tax=Penicillium verrucosum TaxID=60171 RepID=UPI002544EB30|nr:uncharacterized protein N7516_006829 [Penicillium verrucosum]KAJ5932340.1 hypothetical protein N7516_006829 [Penicillium verrucosum]